MYIKLHRKYIPSLLARFGLPANVKSTEMMVQKEDGALLTFTIYHPVPPKQETRDTLPTLLYVPGTGFNTLILPGWSSIICSHFAKKSKYQVMALHHRLAPEYPFPTPIDDIEFLVKHIMEHSKKYKINLDHIILGGYSSGGNIATVVSQRLNGIISFKALYLIGPMLDLSRPITRFKKYEDRDSFPEKLVKWMINTYAKSTNKKNPELSPYLSELQNLPNIIRIFAGENDRFRGDSELFTEKIELTTNKFVTKSIFKGTKHVDFWYNINCIETIIKLLRLDNIKIPKNVFTL